MLELIEVLAKIEDFTAINTEEIVKEWIASKGYNMGGVMNAFRLSIVGEPKGPHMFDIIAVLGRDETISRLRRAIETIIFC
jgi:glutamyl-tRNA synthetase